jgi:hypothetical protein
VFRVSLPVDHPSGFMRCYRENLCGTAAETQLPMVVLSRSSDQDLVPAQTNMCWGTSTAAAVPCRHRMRAAPAPLPGKVWHDGEKPRLASPQRVSCHDAGQPCNLFESKSLHRKGSRDVLCLRRCRRTRSAYARKVINQVCSGPRSDRSTCGRLHLRVTDQQVHIAPMLMRFDVGSCASLPNARGTTITSPAAPSRRCPR